LSAAVCTSIAQLRGLIALCGKGRAQATAGDGQQAGTCKQRQHGHTAAAVVKRLSASARRFNDYKVVIFYLLVDAPIRSTVVLDRKLIVLQRTFSSQL
jgi:hypothetical protein